MREPKKLVVCTAYSSNATLLHRAERTRTHVEVSQDLHPSNHKLGLLFLRNSRIPSRGTAAAPAAAAGFHQALYTDRETERAGKLGPC